MTEYWCDCVGWSETDQMCGIYIESLKNKDKQGAYFEAYSEKKTNNELEYLAVIEALMLAQDGDVVYSDSQLVVNQIHGKYSVKTPHLRPYYEAAKEFYSSKKVKLIWIPREDNMAGIAVEKGRAKLCEQKSEDSIKN